MALHLTISILQIQKLFYKGFWYWQHYLQLHAHILGLYIKVKWRPPIYVYFLYLYIKIPILRKFVWCVSSIFFEWRFDVVAVTFDRAVCHSTQQTRVRSLPEEITTSSSATQFSIKGLHCFIHFIFLCLSWMPNSLVLINFGQNPWISSGFQ